MEWKEKYPPKIKPAYNELLDFFQENICGLFLRFNQIMNEKYGVQNRWQRYENAYGWVYGFCRNYRCELLYIIVQNDCFCVLNVPVKDEKSLQEALEKADEKYNNGYEKRYDAICEKQRANQIEHTKKRIEREKAQMVKITENVNLEKFNKFKWCKKVSRNDLLKLYQSEAKGIIDEELLDKVGYTFYIRCMQAKQTRELMEQGQILCLNCGGILSADFSKDNQPIICECGYSYTYREYRRSCNTANMPGGRAAPIFEHFVKEWPICKDTSQKMMLIDWLIHECHVTLMSGLKGRSVCINLIEGTSKQISDLIMKLSYGSSEGKIEFEPAKSI
ncbi:MAG: hypothetical protein LBI03_01645 [Clostridiales bacterium]|jgi:hypothetical protein|nr:hypothetical protein [Clostridiales bacterium]